jgi:integrase
MSDSEEWRLGMHRGKWAAVRGRGKSRRRIKLDETDEESAKSAVRALNTETERLKLSGNLTVDEIFELYKKDRKAKGVVNLKRIEEVRKTIKPFWGGWLPDKIKDQDCAAFVDARRLSGCSNSTIRSDLSYTHAALNFAFALGLIAKCPKFEMPPPSRPRDRWLNRYELEKLLDGAVMLHVKLFIILAVTTAGRPKHILALTWDRVDLKNRVIDLDDGRDRTRKGRARVPINDTALDHLKVAFKARGKSERVIEIDGRAIASIRNGIRAAAKRAKLRNVSQYVLRHTAGVYMAQAGVPLAEIAEYMGHTSIETTRKHYAKFGPDHLRRAAGALEIIRRTSGSGVPTTMNGETTKSEENQYLPLASEA